MATMWWWQKRGCSGGIQYFSLTRLAVGRNVVRGCLWEEWTSVFLPVQWMGVTASYLCDQTLQVRVQPLPVCPLHIVNMVTLIPASSAMTMQVEGMCGGGLRLRGYQCQLLSVRRVNICVRAYPKDRGNCQYVTKQDLHIIFYNSLLVFGLNKIRKATWNTSEIPTLNFNTVCKFLFVFKVKIQPIRGNLHDWSLTRK